MKCPLRTVLAVLALAVALSAAGCGDSHGAGSPTPSDSGIKGRTLVDGGCPMVREDSPCPDRPLRARLTITGGSPERTVAETTSDADGHFRISLPPGTYTIRPTNLTGAMTPIAQPVSVTVKGGRFTMIVISFDSGIR
ncbi:carboxypeptidase-like regulatory domain-containing protein [Streptomyces olivochromogenes]|uniref:carboxypeptidase-like regulatory domain-containing protein n=1 Tax=Streptomyces olivochromogenes TaxID=1963 RepID=UPI001F3435CA|nr:carboxypeptidase-like regulatory domain-containing protein [Streptomyces olivochromogenes]MCF3132121.1 carboxypeptidase regulatory-like domain-containing protein [Streptomyces olivochromogenes]